MLVLRPCHIKVCCIAGAQRNFVKTTEKRRIFEVNSHVIVYPTIAYK
jgi:hypothetical protein